MIESCSRKPQTKSKKGSKEEQEQEISTPSPENRYNNSLKKKKDPPNNHLPPFLSLCALASTMLCSIQTSLFSSPPSRKKKPQENKLLKNTDNEEMSYIYLFFLSYSL